MRRKRIVSLFLTLVMLCSLLSLQAAAEGNAVLTVESPADAYWIGDTFTLKADLSNNPGWCNVEIIIDYDNDVLELQSINTSYPVNVPGVGTINAPYLCATSVDVNGNPQSAAVAVNRNYREGKYTDKNYGFLTSAIAADVTVAEGTFFTMTFKVIGKPASGSTQVKLIAEQFRNYSGTVTKDMCTTVPGTITIAKAAMTTVSATVEQPVKGQPLQTAVTLPSDAAYTATVKWYEGQGTDGTLVTYPKAKAGMQYTASIEVTPNEGESFAENVANSDSTYAIRVENGHIFLVKIFRVTDPAGALEGSVNLRGTARFGETLTAVPTLPSEAETLHYAWYQGSTLIPGVDGDQYTLRAEDIGKKIEVRVSADGFTGYVSAVSDEVGRKKNTTSPIVTDTSNMEITDTTIEVKNVQANQEYLITAEDVLPGEDASWTDGASGSVKFDDRTPNTKYTVWTRIKATETVEAGPYAGIGVTTKKLTQTITAVGGTVISVRFGETLDLNTVVRTNAPGGTLRFAQSSGSIPAGVAFTPAGVVNAAGATGEGSFVVTVNADAVGDYDAAVPLTLTINILAKPLNVFADGFTAAADKIYGDASFKRAASLTTGDGAITYESSAPDVATVAADGTVTILKNGTAIITAKAAETTNYGAAQISYTLTVAQREVQIRWNNAENRVVGDGKVVSAEITNKVGNDDVALVVTGGDATAVGGPYTATAALSGTKKDCYKLPAQHSVQYSISAKPLNVFADGFTAAMNKTYGDASFKRAASLSKGNGAITYESSNPDVATVAADGTVTILKNGTAIITAKAAETEAYGAAQASYTLTVAQREVQIRWGNTTGRVYGDNKEVTAEITNKVGNDDVYLTVIGGNRFTAGGPYTATVNLGGTKAGCYKLPANASAEYSIAQATPTGRPELDRITSAGQTLGSSNLRTGTLNPAEGTLEWVDEQGNPLNPDTVVEANKTYTWKFTPTDPNYETIYGQVKLYTAQATPGTSYTVTVLPAENGKISSSARYADAGITVILTATPDSGSSLQSISVKDGSGKTVALQDLGNGKYSFVMPASPVTVEGSFRKQTPSSTLPFTDVKSSDWFYGDVEYVYGKNLMTGTTATSFGPYVNTTRGMIVTILYRMEGQPEVNGTCTFTDVEAGMYYEKAIIWAAANGIVDGYGNGKFGPKDEITRQQLAAILWRYAKLKGYDVSVGENTNILSYNDATEVAEYAVPALQWACGAGLIQGDNGSLRPAGKATRCQVAAILHRFSENVAK